MVLIADNITITNKSIEAALKALDPAPIQEMAKKCEAAGAGALDINTGPLTRDPKKKAAFLVETIQEVTNLPLLIDTGNPKAIEAALDANKQRMLINGFSLELSKLTNILPLAKKYNVEIIGYLLYPDSHVPINGEERCAVAVELFKEFSKWSIDPNNLIIDPIVVPVSWNNFNVHAMDVLSTIRMLPDLLGFPVRTIAGLSNLTSGGPPGEKRILLEKSYLAMLAASGLSMALLNIFHDDTVRVARACKSILSSNIFSWEEL